MKLDSTKVKVFNPLVENWDDAAKINEIYHRENDDICVYGLTSEMVGEVSLFEIIEDSKKRPEKTVLCILNEHNGKRLNTLQKIKILITKILIIESNIIFFTKLDDVAKYLNSYEKLILKRNITISNI